MLENTAGLRPSGRVEARAHAFGSNHDQLAGFHLALVSGANQVKSAGLGGEHNGVVFFGSLSRNSPHREGPESARIASREDTVSADHHQRECSLDPAKRVGHGFGQSLLLRERYQVNNNFGIAVGLKDRALALKASADFMRIDQVSIVGDGDLAL